MFNFTVRLFYVGGTRSGVSEHVGRYEGAHVVDAINKACEELPPEALITYLTARPSQVRPPAKAASPGTGVSSRSTSR